MTTTALSSPTTAEAIRASDADRERALDLLRDHWLAGRLTLDEYEERCDEAGAVLALILGVMSLGGVVLSLGMLFVLTLPASTWAWSLGRRARRGTRGAIRAVAGTAEALGILATAIACLPLAGCALWLAT